MGKGGERLVVAVAVVVVAVVVVGVKKGRQMLSLTHYQPVSLSPHLCVCVCFLIKL